MTGTRLFAPWPTLREPLKQRGRLVFQKENVVNDLVT